MSAARVRLPVVIMLVVVGWPFPVRADDQTSADEATLKEARLKIDGPSLLEFFRKRTLSPAREAALEQTVQRLGAKAFAARERASGDLMAAGRPALRFLRPALKNPDLEIARRAAACLDKIDKGADVPLTLAAARLLAVRRPAGATQVVLNYLPFADEESVAEEVVATLGRVAVRDGKADRLLIAALKDGKAERRAAAALLLGRLPRPEYRAAVRPLLADPDAAVRLRAAQSLLVAREKKALPVLVALLDEAPPTLAWQAEDLLCRLAGEQGPQLSIGDGNEEQRKKCRAAWARWWRDQEPKIDLARLDRQPPSLGLTLVVTCDGYDGCGKVWEFGTDRKPRWQISTNLRGAIDARVLPGNRILLAEYNGYVTERDQKGKVLREHRIQGNPVACQRLPNGNTFVATLSNVLEITAQGKEVFNYPAGHGQITYAEKLRNGHLIYVTMSGMLAEVDARGKEIKSFKVGSNNVEWFTFERLPGEHYLVPQQSANKIVEFDRTGKVVWQVAAPNPYCATRLPNGHILSCSMGSSLMVEVDRTGKTVWKEQLGGRPFMVRRR
jgi:hypothetical protein